MKDLNILREKVTEMATVMHKAVEVDERVEQNEVEMMAKLKCENKTLRELLNISGHPKNEIEKLKHRERLEEENLLMNGDLAAPEDRLIDSSADEMDDGMDTVKRKGKIGATAPNGHTSSNGCVFNEFLGSAGDRSSVMEVKKQGKDENLKGESKRRTDDQSLKGQASNIKGNDDSFSIEPDTSSVGEVIPNHVKVCLSEQHDIIFESNDGAILNSVESSDKGDVPIDKEIDEHWNENVVEEDGSWENNKEGLIVHEESFRSSDSESKQKLEDLMDLYNSEGILGEDNEDNLSKRKSLGHDSKMSGIKFRRSTKQKKVIQADLKSYFQTEEGFDRGLDGEEAARDDRESDSSKIRIVTEAHAARLKGEKDLKVNDMIEETNSELTSGDSFQSEAFPHSAENQIFYGSMMNKELSDVAEIEKYGLDMTGNRIVNIDYNFSPPDSPSDSPELTERQEGKHRTLQLDYSDSDSDDPDMMVEDQFGDISDESDSSSSSDSDDAAGVDDLDSTEEELIGTLDESGELVISMWSRSANEYEHLDEGGEKFLVEKTSVDTMMAVDSAVVVDSSMPAVDSLTTVVASSMEAVDSSTAVVDSSTAVVDSSAAVVDSSTAVVDSSMAAVDSLTAVVDTSMAAIDSSTTTVDSSKTVKNETQCNLVSSSNEFAFSQAFMQQDQFTGGSIKAKFAKRKRYQNASRANAVTLLAGADAAKSPRGNIRSDSDLSLEAENQPSDLGGVDLGSDSSPTLDTENQQSDVGSDTRLTLETEDQQSDLGSDSSLTQETGNQQSDFDQVTGSERAGCEMDSTSSDPDLSAGVLSPVRSDTSLTSSDSSSGEIDPTIFMQRLAGSERDRSQSQGSTDLAGLLSELDAKLELEDSDSS